MRFFSWVLVLLACLGVGGLLGLYKYNEIQAAIARGQAFPEPAQAVEIYVVEEQARTPYLTVSGEVVARRSAILRNELKGNIAEVNFAPGAKVTAGSVLIKLDTQQEQAQLAEAQAEQKIAQLALDRAKRLLKTGAGSVEARDQARAQTEAARARVRGLKALIEKKTLTAPFDAIAGLHQLEPGQFLDAGSEITELVSTAQRAWVDFAVPQEHADLQVGQLVEIVTNQRIAPAKVSARDAAVSTRSRNLTLRAELDQVAAHLLPGMLVQVRIPLGDAQSVTVVPATAVRRDAFGASVYVLEEVEEAGQQKTRARKQAVTLTMVRDPDQSQDWVVVTDGLVAGEKIAGIGAFKLFDGALVMASQPNQQAAERWVGH